MATHNHRHYRHHRHSRGCRTGAPDQASNHPRSGGGVEEGRGRGRGKKGGPAPQTCLALSSDYLAIWSRGWTRVWGLFSGSHPSLSKPHHSVFFPGHLPWFPALARAIPPTLNKTHPAAPKHPHLLPKPVQFKTPFLHYPVGGGAALSETTGSSHSNYTPPGTLTRTIHPKLSPFLNPTSCSTQDVFPLDQVQIPECATHTPSKAGPNPRPNHSGVHLLAHINPHPF